MKILFDLNHPADVNFFKSAILKLKNSGVNVRIIFRDRGMLEKIIKYELPNIPIKKIGRHYRGFFKKIFFQLIRDIYVFRYIHKYKICKVCCFGSNSAISTWLSGAEYLAFDDDYEYKIPFYHANIFCKYHIYPDFIPFKNKKTIKYSGFKELAYLNPKNLKFSNEILEQYFLEPDRYVFVREIQSISLNYKKSNDYLKKIISELKSFNLKVVLSLEDKTIKKKYEEDCIILFEPVKDIYSLIYNSLFLISSGDSMAREASLMGTPCIYTGRRDMYMNKHLIDIGVMFKEDTLENTINRIGKLVISNNKKSCRKLVLSKIENNWDDTTELILNIIKNKS